MWGWTLCVPVRWRRRNLPGPARSPPTEISTTRKRLGCRVSSAAALIAVAPRPSRRGAASGRHVRSRGGRPSPLALPRLVCYPEHGRNAVPSPLGRSYEEHTHPRQPAAVADRPRIAPSVPPPVPPPVSSRRAGADPGPVEAAPLPAAQPAWHRDKAYVQDRRVTTRRPRPRQTTRGELWICSAPRSSRRSAT